MANLPLGFAELAAGAVLLIAGLQNKTPAQVLLGQPSTAAPSVTPSTPTSPTSPASPTTPASPGAPVAPAPAIPGVPGTLGQGQGAKAAQAALTFLNVPYVYGAMSRLGIDCSGLVVEAYKAVGIDLPHNAAQQWLLVKQHGTVTSLQSAMTNAGELIFLEPSSNGPDHVAISTGNGYAVEAPHSGDVVKTIKISDLVHYDGLVGVGTPYA